MTKKIIAVAISALLVLLCSIGAFAATEPTVTSDTICYISYQTGNNDYDGQTVDTAKRQFLTLDDAGCIGVLANGGTLYVVGKAYIGGEYTMPELGSTLKITSNDGKANYQNSMPFENPVCAFKMASGVTLTLQQDTIFDDIILFQEQKMNTIAITNNSTLVIGDKVNCMTNIANADPCYMAISVEAGSTAILNGGTFQQVTGEGTIINNGATILSEQEAEATTAETTDTTAPEVTTAETTTAPAVTSGAVVVPDLTTESTDASTDAAATEDTTIASTEESKKPVDTTEETESKTVDTTAEDKNEETAPATVPATVEPKNNGGLGTGAIIGIVAAVVVVIAVVAVILVKKKKK